MTEPLGSAKVSSDQFLDRSVKSNTGRRVSLCRQSLLESRAASKPPMLFPVHGGAILDREFFNAYLQRLQTSDVLIASGSSDITILRRFFGEAVPIFCYDTNLFR